MKGPGSLTSGQGISSSLCADTLRSVRRFELLFLGPQPNVFVKLC